jgi:hypothetical protein
MSKQNTKRSSSAEPASARTAPLDLDLLVEDPKADLPTISAMMTPAQRSRDNILHLRATERTLQQRIKYLEFELTIAEAHTKNRLQDANIPVGPSAPPTVTKSPGPHCLQPKPERPADIAYRQKLEATTSRRICPHRLNRRPDKLTGSASDYLQVSHQSVAKQQRPSAVQRCL